MLTLRFLNAIFLISIFSICSCDSSVQNAQRCFDSRDYEKATVEIKKANQSDPQVIKLKFRIDSATAYVTLKDQLRLKALNDAKRIQDSIEAIPVDLRLLNEVKSILGDLDPPYVYEMSDVKKLLAYYQEVERKLDVIKRSDISEVKSHWKGLAENYNRLRNKRGPQDRGDFGRALGRLFQSQGTDVYVKGTKKDHLVLEGVAFYNQYDRIDVETALMDYVGYLGFKKETYQLYEGSDRESTWNCNAYYHPEDWAYSLK
jgi:hypothetical protein